MAALVVLLVASALFVAAEFALVAARRSLVEPSAVRSARARATLAAMDDVSVMMACAQLGITVCGLVIGAVGEPVVARLVEPALAAISLPAGATAPLAFVIALLVVTAAHVAFGEMVPKNIALAGPERVAVVLAPALRRLATALGPIVRGLDRLATMLIRALGVTPATETASTANRQQVGALVAQSARAGLLDPEDERLVDAALAFEERRVRDITLPDKELIAVGPYPTRDDVEDACARSGFSRFPVRAADRDAPSAFRGFVHVRDVLVITDRNHPLPDRLIYRLAVIDADASLRTALEAMQRSRTHMCRVAGATGEIGLVLLEDVIEVLVGEVADATRRGRGTPAAGR